MPLSSAVRRRGFLRSAAPDGPPLTVTIERIGHRGDGLGRGDDGRLVCVSGTLPGERLLVEPSGRRGDVMLGRPQQWLRYSPERVTPPCPHFGSCGGCALQHWTVASYLRWKSDLLRQALQGAGYNNPPIMPIASTGPQERRRIDLAFVRSGSSVVLGLHKAGASEIADITGCLVLHPAIKALLLPLQALLGRLPSAGNDGRVAINLTDTGADIVVRTAAMPNIGERTVIAEFIRSHAVPRVHWAIGRATPEAVCIHRTALIRFAGAAGVEVAVPPDAFLQASRPAEAALVALVQQGLAGLRSGRPKLIELYAGCGTLTFALADIGVVTAYEGNAAAVNALRTAASRCLPGRIMCHQRDLVRQPLMAHEFGMRAAVVLDPPWGGASTQINEIAKSKSERVVYISCNPLALGNDAAKLRAAGFAITAATPVDQFLWSAQLESVVVFTR